MSLEAKIKTKYRMTNDGSQVKQVLSAQDHDMIIYNDPVFAATKLHWIQTEYKYQEILIECCFLLLFIFSSAAVTDIMRGKFLVWRLQIGVRFIIKNPTMQTFRNTVYLGTLTHFKVKPICCISVYVFDSHTELIVGYWNPNSNLLSDFVAAVIGWLEN